MAMPIQIGDVIALANMCYGIAQAFGSGRKAAPVEFREVQNELYELGQMLELLKDSVQSGVLGPTVPNVVSSPLIDKAYRSIAQMINNCEGTVCHLKDFAKRYSPLAGVEFVEDKAGGVKVRKLPSNASQKIKFNWKRIMWVKETSNIQGIRDQISIHVQSINAVVSLVNTHKTNAVQEEIRHLAGYAEGHRQNLSGARMEIDGARREIYNVHVAANAGIYQVSSEVNSVRQDVQSLNHKLEAIIAWQQRDMPAEQLKQQLSHLFSKLEQLERMPQQPYPSPSASLSPSSGGILPYPTDDPHLEMPNPYMQSIAYPSSSSPSSADFYASSSSLVPEGGSFARGDRPHASWTSTQVASTSISILPVELPTRRPTRKNGYVPSPFESPLEASREALSAITVNSEPIEIASQPIREENRPPRASRATPTDIVFELCLETRVGDGVAVFETLCLHARFHGNWKNAIENREYNEGLFACLCEPFEDEDEDIEPHAQKLERFTLTNGTIGCHYHGKVQWILHNVKDSQAGKPVTLGIRDLTMQNAMKFERTFTEPIAIRTAKAISSGAEGNYFAYEVNSEVDGRQVAILNSMADDSFQAYLESVTFTVEKGDSGEPISRENVTHTNLLHYKTIRVEEISENQTINRDAFKHSEYVEMLVIFGETKREDQPSELKLLLDEVNLESNSSEDPCIVTITMTKGEATFETGDPRLRKVMGVAEFKFKKREAADEFCQQLRYMSNELHTLKIQHAKRNELVMVKLFADHIAAANNVQMNEVEIVVVWDPVRRKGRILARSRDGSCYFSQTLHANFFERFADLKRGNLFTGAAEFYRPAIENGQKVEKLPEGVGRIRFHDSKTDNMFYARLTESARRFGFQIEPKAILDIPKSESQTENSDDRSIVQTRGSQMKRANTTRNYSAEHYRKIIMETAAIEFALPTQKLTRPLDAEELLDLLNQTEEKLLYNMEDPKLPIIAGPLQDDSSHSVGTSSAVLTPSGPSEWTAEQLEKRKKERGKPGRSVQNTANTPTEGAVGEIMSEEIGHDILRRMPQTAQTTPGLSTPEAESNQQLRRPASFDTLRTKRESEKVLIPPQAPNKSGIDFLFPEPAFPKYQRSHSVTSSHTTATISPGYDSDVAKSMGLEVIPAKERTDEPEFVQSPESYSPLNRRGPGESLVDGLKKSDGEPFSTATPPPRRLPENSFDESGGKSASKYDGPDSIYEPPSSTSSYSLPIIATEKNVRAYRLVVDFDDQLPHGTLVWVDESDSKSKKYERGISSVRVLHFQKDLQEWVPKGMLKQGRYYAMKPKEGTYRTTDGDGSVVKLRSNQIVIALEDEAESQMKDELHVVPLEARYSVPVNREWLTEVNLSFQMP